MVEQECVCVCVCGGGGGERERQREKDTRGTRMTAALVGIKRHLG